MTDAVEPTVAPDGSNTNDVIDELEDISKKIIDVRNAVGRIIFGQQPVIEETLITLLSGGHVLLIGVPGLGRFARNLIGGLMR